MEHCCTLELKCALMLDLPICLMMSDENLFDKNMLRFVNLL